MIGRLGIGRIYLAYRTIIDSLIVMAVFPLSLSAHLMSVTIDNDIFLGKDNGYTNGIFISWFDLGNMHEMKEVPSRLLTLLIWSLPRTEAWASINTHTIGQIMATPDNITLKNPDPEDMPYAGLLFYTTSHLKIYKDSADQIALTLGVIGPLSGAEYVQKRVHEITGSTRPEGWDYQLKNEAVFQLSRSRIWRVWATGKGRGKFDFLLSGEFRLGTISSEISTSSIFRFGTDLSMSFAAPVLDSSRACNPLSLDGGWYFYTGIEARYITNMIFTDGNTFRGSRSTELDHTQFGVMAGLSYSLKSLAVTIAVEDFSMFENQNDGPMRFGTITIAFRF